VSSEPSARAASRQRNTLGEVAGAGVPSGEGSAGGAGGGGEDAEGAEVAAVAVAGFAAAGFAGGLVRAAGGRFAAVEAAGASVSSSANTGLGEIIVVGAVPASPVCIEPESFTAIRTGTLCV
jgi:hypothetical protein